MLVLAGCSSSRHSGGVHRTHPAPLGSLQLAEVGHVRPLVGRERSLVPVAWPPRLLVPSCYLGPGQGSRQVAVLAAPAGLPAARGASVYLIRRCLPGCSATVHGDTMFHAPFCFAFSSGA